MRIKTYGLIAAATLALSACGGSEAERALSGAGIGGITAAALGGDPTLGLAVGAVAGILCNDFSPGYCLGR